MTIQTRGTRLAALARKIDAKRGGSEHRLPDGIVARVRELCAHVKQRTGLTALFTGPSAADKLVAAQKIAAELGRDLHVVDLNQLVDKYIGETEKHLESVLAAAEHANTVLLFDESDALFGKRTDVRDAHDRYANVETSYLLQRIEEYKGIAILATNLRQELDPALVRRFAFALHFPAPDKSDP